MTRIPLGLETLHDSTGLPADRLLRLIELAGEAHEDPKYLVERIVARSHSLDPLDLAGAVLRSAPHPITQHRGDGRDVMIKLPVMVENVRETLDAKGYPVRERIIGYDGIDTALLLWRHDQHRGPIGHIVATRHLGSGDVLVWAHVDDDQVAEQLIFEGCSASIGGTVLGDPDRRQTRTGMAQDIVAAVAEVSLCGLDEAVYDVPVSLGRPPAYLAQELDHRRAAIAATGVPRAEPHIQSRTFAGGRLGVA